MEIRAFTAGMLFGILTIFLSVFVISALVRSVKASKILFNIIELKQNINRELYMNNRRRQFFLNGILLTIVGLAIRSVSIAFNSYITKTVGAEGIGLFSLIMNIYSFAITFATSGISLTVTRLIAEAIGQGHEGECRKIMRNAVLYSLIFSITAASVMFFFADYFSLHFVGDERSGILLRILSVSLVPLSLSSLISGYFVGVKRVFRNATVQVTGQIFKILITLWSIFTFSKRGVVYTVIALTLSITLTEIFCFLVLFIEYQLDKKRIKFSTGKCETRFSHITSMALPLALSAYIRSALLTLEHTLIPKGLMKRGDTVSEALASYGILHGMAVPMLLYPMSTLTSFAGLLVPEFAESEARCEKERMKRLAGEALGTTLVYATVTTVMMYIFAEELGYVLYNSYYAGHYIALMSFVIPIMYMDHVADSMLKGIGEHVYSMWVNIADALISVILVWVLIPIMGIGGYAVVIVVMEGFNFTLSITKLYKRIPFKINFVKSFFLPLCASVVSALASKHLFIFSGSEAKGGWLALIIIFAVCVFLALYTFIKKFGNGKKPLPN